LACLKIFEEIIVFLFILLKERVVKKLKAAAHHPKNFIKKHWKKEKGRMLEENKAMALRLASM
jgi:hypothetical protein